MSAATSNSNDTESQLTGVQQACARVGAAVLFSSDGQRTQTRRSTVLQSAAAAAGGNGGGDSVDKK